MPFTMDEASQVRSVQRALLTRFDGRVPAEVLCSEIGRAVDRYREARVRTFVPVLVEREVRAKFARVG